MKSNRCPNGQTISVYLDGELASDQAGRIESHVAACHQCRSRLRDYQSVSHQLLEGGEPDVAHAEHLVWSRLELARRAVARQGFWRRLVSIPAPIVYGTAAVLVALAGAAALQLDALWRSPADGAVAAAVGSEVRVAAPREDVEQLLHRLTGGDQQPMVIQLPAGSEFHMLGRPAILREDELARGVW